MVNNITKPAKSLDMSHVMEDLMGDNDQPMITIRPKTLRFVIEQPDAETSESLFLTNNSNSMEIFKVRSRPVSNESTGFHLYKVISKQW